MMFSGYSRRSGGGGDPLPRVVQVSVDRRGTGTGGRSRAVEFVVAIHEEGTAFTWQDRVSVTAETERRLLERTTKLHLWSLSVGLTRSAARKAATQLGRDLIRGFLGRKGAEVLAALDPTAIIFSADETMLNLPWEAMRIAGGPIDPTVPFGRAVASAMVPRARRDPLEEDATVRILVVANPTADLPASEAVIEVVTTLAGHHGGVDVQVEALSTHEATRAGFAAAVRGENYDIIHFAGHGSFSAGAPDESAIVLADGAFAAADVARLRWEAPPYIVFNSACESARAAGEGLELTAVPRANGLVGAFLAAGSEAYIGHFWPVGDASAAAFSATFYNELFATRNVGTALTRGREALDGAFVVSVAETAAAVRLLAEQMRVVAEGAGALALAAALAGHGEGKIVCIVSGGNIDLAAFASLVGACRGTA